MSYPQIVHHGAVAGVTGSCHQLQIDAEHGLLVDCGLFQGAEVSPEGGAGADNLAIDFSLAGIKALIVTHVHIDHVGRIPYLLAAGFKGPILCSEPSAKLLPIVLEDAFKLGFSRDQQQVERYLSLLEQRIIPLPYDSWFTLADNAQIKAAIRLQRAGHILGSAYVEVDLTYKQAGSSKRIVFSGDLGAPHSPLLPAPKAPERADILVIESTYGDRLHEDRRTRRHRLEQVIEQALSNKGSVLIPAFSIGRTQELLYELEDILHDHPSLSGRGAEAAEKRPDTSRESEAIDWHSLPVILDSPLASRFTQVYRELEPFWDIEALARVREGRKPLSFANLLTVDSHQAHLAMVRRLAETAQPAIVIAAGGMCAGGRIVDYLKAMLHDPRHDVLFVGYQAQGTPGRAIQTHGPSGGYVLLDEVRYNIGAKILTIGGYSAHADQQGLVDFVTQMREWPSEIRIVHGDGAAKKALAELYQTHYQQANRDVKVSIPGSVC
jgi:metallo-beta-lactamase family protein